MNKFIISSVLVGVLSVGYWALAEDSVPTPTHVPTSPSVRAKIQEQKALLKQEVQDKKTEVKNEIQSLKDDIQKKTQEFKDAVKVKQSELENQIKTKRAALQAGLKKIKDTAKQQTVETIDKQIDNLNSQTMAHFSDMLDKMSAVLVKIGDRVDKASQQGYDVSSVRTAIDSANKAITAARSAIVTQSGKTYTIKVTTDTGLKGDVKKARDALHNDLTVVKNIIQAANDAVHKAAVALGQLKGQSPLPSPSTVCTQEAKLCPDGSSVSRTGPNCEFAACPGETQPQ